MSATDRLRPPPPLVPPPLDDTPRIIGMLAQVLDLPYETVRKILWQNEHDHGSIFRQEFVQAGLMPYVWSDALERFYADTDCYLHGAVMWNRRPAKLQMRGWIGDYLARDGQPLDVLTVGDGPGFDSQYLADWGHRVTYSEISPKCMQFARQMLATAATPARIVEGVESVEPESQDVVLCLDVLEHLPDPGWMVSKIVRCLRPGGRFIVHAPFFFVSPANPTHLASNRKYSGDWRKLYGKHGLRPVDGSLFWDPLVLLKQIPNEPAPRVPWRTRVRLAFGQWLLTIGRHWNGPHNFIAHRMMFDRDDRWINELSALADAHDVRGVSIAEGGQDNSSTKTDGPA
ncbi:MAG: class I SAM-dependent methyltransferase [Pirellulales bacterium]